MKTDSNEISVLDNYSSILNFEFMFFILTPDF